MSAGLTISDSIYARVDGASFGLILNGTELGFATSGGSFDLSLARLIRLRNECRDYLHQRGHNN